MVLYFIGLGLGDERDITVKGLEAVKSADVVFLEAYTAILSGIDKTRLEEFYGKTIVEADRHLVESEAEKIIDPAKDGVVAFLVVGDPYAATTHTDLLVRATSQGVKVVSIHNASIMNAIAVCGLQLYNFGRTVSIVFFRDAYRPDSFYQRIKTNRDAGLHTMCLLDIRVKEPTEESLMNAHRRGYKMQYEPPSFMSIRQCIDQLLEVEHKHGLGVYSEDTVCVGVARLAAEDQLVVSGKMSDLRRVDFGAPLHTLVVPGETHFVEEEVLEFYNWANQGLTLLPEDKDEASEDASEAAPAAAAATTEE